MITGRFWRTVTPTWACPALAGSRWAGMPSKITRLRRWVFSGSCVCRMNRTNWLLDASTRVSGGVTNNSVSVSSGMFSRVTCSRAILLSVLVTETVASPSASLTITTEVSGTMPSARATLAPSTANATQQRRGIARQTEKIRFIAGLFKWAAVRTVRDRCGGGAVLEVTQVQRDRAIEGHLFLERQGVGRADRGVDPQGGHQLPDRRGQRVTDAGKAHEQARIHVRLR